MSIGRVIGPPSLKAYVERNPTLVDNENETLRMELGRVVTERNPQTNLIVCSESDKLIFERTLDGEQVLLQSMGLDDHPWLGMTWLMCSYREDKQSIKCSNNCYPPFYELKHIRAIMKIYVIMLIDMSVTMLFMPWRSK